MNNTLSSIWSIAERGLSNLSWLAGKVSGSLRFLENENCVDLQDELLKIVNQRKKGPISSRIRSSNGSRFDRIELDTRLFPYLCMEGYQNNNEIFFSMAVELLRQGVIEGQWGNTRDKSQLIVEMADVAIGIYIAPKVLSTFSLNEIEKISEWLESALYVDACNNNWQLFPIVIQEVLFSVFKVHKSSRYRLDEIIDDLYLDGVFKDGRTGSVDLYNYWGFLYAIYMLVKINGEKYGAVGRKVISEMVSVAYAISTDREFPIWGRSQIYGVSRLCPFFMVSGDTKYSRRGELILARELDLIYQSGGFIYWGTSIKHNAYSGQFSLFWSLRVLIVKKLGGVVSALDVQEVNSDCEAVKTFDVDGYKLVYIRPNRAFSGCEDGSCFKDKLKYLIYHQKNPDPVLKEPYFLKVMK